jgi:hypothetical protein
MIQPPNRRASTCVMTVTCVMALLLASCDREGISAQIRAQLDSTTSGTIDLSRVGPPTWTRVCILGPYSTNETATQLLGFPWDAEAASSIATDDAIALLVFVSEQQVVASAEHRRDQGDFAGLGGRCFMRDRAILVRHVTSDGRVHLSRSDE